METFSALLAIYAGNSPVSGEFPAQRPVKRSFDVFFDHSPNTRFSKQSWGWQFETHSSPLWRHSNAWTEDSDWYIWIAQRMNISWSYLGNEKVQLFSTIYYLCEKLYDDVIPFSDSITAAVNIYSISKNSAHGLCFIVLSVVVILVDLPIPFRVASWPLGSITFAPVPVMRLWRNASLG